jgi:hypothetical protein
LGGKINECGKLYIKAFAIKDSFMGIYRADKLRLSLQCGVVAFELI